MRSSPLVPLELAALAVLGFLACAGTTPRSGPERDLEAPAPWKETLSYRVGDGTYWWTSNAAYAADGKEAPAYGTAWTYGIGGASAHGCLFAETADGDLLQWEFYQAWDPIRRQFYSHQTAPAGAVGVRCTREPTDRFAAGARS